MAVIQSVSSLEQNFNRRHGYPYIFVNDKPFTKHFKMTVRRFISQHSKAKVKFGLVPTEHWDVPKHIDMDAAQKLWNRYRETGMVYGDSKTYRQMCRYFSGFFFDHSLLKGYDYYWRLEPGISFLCNIPFDPFYELIKRRKRYGFVILFSEIAETVPGLWRTVLEFREKNHQMLKKNSMFDYFKDDNGGYNLCHYWNNFEIADLSLYRSKEYRAYFKHLDESGGFFYERWGDAPVHSLATGLFLGREEVHYFDNIGYKHNWYSHCPIDPIYRKEQQCTCNATEEGETYNNTCQQLWNDFQYEEDS